MRDIRKRPRVASRGRVFSVQNLHILVYAIESICWRHFEKLRSHPRAPVRSKGTNPVSRGPFSVSLVREATFNANTFKLAPQLVTVRR